MKSRPEGRENGDKGGMMVDGGFFFEKKYAAVFDQVLTLTCPNNQTLNANISCTI